MIGGYEFISDNIKKIKTAISGNKMMENLSEVSSFHRIQGSEGYRNSAKYCFDLLNDYGIDAEILEYKADYNEKFANPYQAASYGYIDDIIEPRNTRFRIIRAFQTLQTKKVVNPLKKHCNIPL